MDETLEKNKTTANTLYEKLGFKWLSKHFASNQDLCILIGNHSELPNFSYSNPLATRRKTDKMNIDNKIKDLRLIERSFSSFHDDLILKPENVNMPLLCYIFGCLLLMCY